MSARSGGRPGVVRILAALLEGPCKGNELIERSGLAASTVRLWLRDMRAAGVVRVCAWEKIATGQSTCPVYEFNPDGKKDVPRPKPVSKSIKAKRYRIRKRFNGRLDLAQLVL